MTKISRRLPLIKFRVIGTQALKREAVDKRVETGETTGKQLEIETISKKVETNGKRIEASCHWWETNIC